MKDPNRRPPAPGADRTLRIATAMAWIAVAGACGGGSGTSAGEVLPEAVMVSWRKTRSRGDPPVAMMKPAELWHRDYAAHRWSARHRVASARRPRATCEGDPRCNTQRTRGESDDGGARQARSRGRRSPDAQCPPIVQRTRSAKGTEPRFGTASDRGCRRSGRTQRPRSCRGRG
jgi:hypothetical protein